MDSQQRQREAEEKQPVPQRDNQPFDPWEQAFNRDFEDKERDFEF